jgi:hypothetical protein
MRPQKSERFQPASSMVAKYSCQNARSLSLTEECERENSGLRLRRKVVETKTAMTPMMVVPVGRAVLVQSINSTCGQGCISTVY